MQRLKSPAYLSWLLLLVCVALLPLVSSMVLFSLARMPLTATYPIIPKLPFFVCLMGLSLFLWCFEQVKRRRLSLRHPLPSLLAAVFLLWALISCLCSLNPAAAFFGTNGSHGLLLYAACAALFFLVLQQLTSADRLLTLARVLVASGAVVAFVALAQSCYAQWGSAPILGKNPWMFLQAGAILGNPDFTAAVLAPLGILAAGLALKETRLRTSLIFGLAFSLMGAAIVVTQSRAAYLALVCALLVLLGITWYVRRQTHARFKWLILTGAILCALGLGLVVTGAQFPGLQKKVTGAAVSTVDAYSSSRLTFWRQALSVCAARPLTGTGPDLYQLGSYRVVAAVAQPTTGDRLYIDDPHSYPLMLAATLGIPALLILLAAGALSLRTLWRTVRKRPLDEKRFVYLIFWAAFLAVGITTCLGSANIAVSASAAVIGGVLLAASNGKTLKKKTSNILPSLFTLATALLLVAGIFYALKPLIADYHLQRYRDTNSEQELQKAVDETPWNFRLQAELITLRTNQLYAAPDAASYHTQFQSLDASLADLCQKHPTELGYILMRDDVIIDAIGQGANPNLMNTFEALLAAQIKQFPKLVDLKLIKSELEFYRGNKTQAMTLLEAQPSSVHRDILRLVYLLDEGKQAQARAALAALKKDWPSSDARNAAIKGAQQQLSGN